MMFGADKLCKEQALLYLSLGPRPWVSFPDTIHEGLMHLAPTIGWLKSNNWSNIMIFLRDQQWVWTEVDFWGKPWETSQGCEVRCFHCHCNWISNITPRPLREKLARMMGPEENMTDIIQRWKPTHLLHSTFIILQIIENKGSMQSRILSSVA